MSLFEGIPNIPDYKGLVSGANDTLIGLGGAGLINAVFGNYWGIFNEYGVPILLVDSVMSLKYQTNSTISQSPIEKGSFASYNKVNDPYKATVRISKGTGGPLERGTFIAQLETLMKSTLKFYIITPEYVYSNAMITGYNISREAHDGARLLKIDLSLEEVRETTVDYDFEEVKNKDDTKATDTGEVKPENKADKKSLLSKASEKVKEVAQEFAKELFKQ